MTLERMTALLIRAGIDPETGERASKSTGYTYTEHVINDDKRKNWPRIEAERKERSDG